MSREGGERFLDRWSRLKRDPAGEQAPPPTAEPENAAAAPPGLAGARTEAGHAVADGTTDDRAIAAGDADGGGPPLPSVDDLTPDSDLSAFFRKGVPQELQRLAMRRMWTLDPGIRDFIEMAENQYDFNLPGGVPGFGELSPGTDLGQLLAQAIGSGPAATPAAEPGSAAEGAPAAAIASVDTRDAGGAIAQDDTGEAPPMTPDRPTPPEVGSSGAVEPVLAGAGEGSLATAGRVAGGPSADGDGAPADGLPTRRRHGGALPL